VPNIVTAPARGQASRRPDAMGHQLRALACRVRHLGHGCSRNVVERDSLGRELELLAEQAEGAR
jgi:hypothetical protein